MRPPRPLLPLLLLITLVTLGGCDSGPTEPSRTLTFTDSIVESVVKTHEVRLQNNGNMRQRLISAKLNELDKPTVDTAVIVGIGLPGPTTCITTSSVLLAAGDVISYGLSAGTYCVTIAAVTVMPANASTDYSLQVEITD
jgi:hypothetical protein